MPKSAEQLTEKSNQTEKPSAWPGFLKSHAVLLAQIENRLRAENLPTLEWYDVLWALEQAPEGKLRMWELADALVISRSNLTRLVDRLAVSGMVERDRDCDDRRGAYAVLTPAGRDIREKIWPAYKKAVHDFFDRHLNRTETGQMRTIFARLIEAAGPPE
jgi:DNA-binding MarR family transcriptional regulator